MVFLLLLLLLLHFGKLWVLKSYGTFLHVIILRCHSSLDWGLLCGLQGWDGPHSISSLGLPPYRIKHSLLCFQVHTHLSKRSASPRPPGTLPNCLLILHVCYTPSRPNNREFTSGGFICDRGKNCFYALLFSQIHGFSSPEGLRLLKIKKQRWTSLSFIFCFSWDNNAWGNLFLRTNAPDDWIRKSLE